MSAANLALVGLLHSLGATPEEMDAVWKSRQADAIPARPSEILSWASDALVEVRMGSDA